MHDWIFVPRIGPKRCRWIPGVYCNTPDDGGSGGGGSGDDDKGGGGGGGGAISEEVRAQIDAAVSAATEGLRTNRDQILGEKRTLQEKVTSLDEMISKLGGSEGVQQLLEMRERLSKDELGSLLADGKHDEWFEKRTSAMRADFDNRVAAIEQERDAAVEKSNSADKRWQTTKLEAVTRAGCAEHTVVESAIQDVLLRADSEFDYDQENDRFVIKDTNGGTVIGKDGKSPKTVGEWIEEQRTVARHWFPPSIGAGAESHLGGGPGDGRPTLEHVGSMTMDEYRASRESMGLKPGAGGGHRLD